jgi:hypothetical protein
LLGTTVFCLFAVLLEVLGNENWRLGSMAALLFAIAAQIAFGSRLRLFPFLADTMPASPVSWLAWCCR